MSKVNAHSVAVIALILILFIPYLALGVVSFLSWAEPELDPRSWHLLGRLAFVVYELAALMALFPLICSVWEDGL